jgi:hypothetical protein
MDGEWGFLEIELIGYLMMMIRCLCVDVDSDGDDLRWVCLFES